MVIIARYFKLKTLAFIRCFASSINYLVVDSQCKLAVCFLTIERIKKLYIREDILKDRWQFFDTRVYSTNEKAKQRAK